jgi:predicted CXXCH cytochrome family protein
MGAALRYAVMRSTATLATLLVAAILALTLGTAGAGEPAWLPKPARGRGDKCVADTAWMRRNHMTALSHQRDGTVHDGIRTSRFSLKACIDCHAVKGADGKPVTVASEKHFCRTCHDYAAVQIDCFECHASRPEAKAATTGEAAPERSSGTDAAMLAQYLRSLKQ